MIFRLSIQHNNQTTIHLISCKQVYQYRITDNFIHTGLNGKRTEQSLNGKPTKQPLGLWLCREGVLIIMIMINLSSYFLVWALAICFKVEFHNLILIFTGRCRFDWQNRRATVFGKCWFSFKSKNAGLGIQHASCCNWSSQRVRIIYFKYCSTYV